MFTRRVFVESTNRKTNGVVPMVDESVPDDYMARLIKYLPTEVIGFYLTFACLVQEQLILGLAVLAIGLVGTPLYLIRLHHVQGWLQPSISTVAFLIWAYATGGVFQELNLYNGPLAGVLVGAATFLFPLLKPKA